MNLKFWFISILIIFCSKINAQVLNVLFVDSSYHPIEGLAILNSENNSVLGFTNSFGFFSIPFEKVEKIKTKSIFWEEISFNLPEKFRKDTLFKEFIATPINEVLDEVIIDKKEFRRVFDPSFGSVIDYFPVTENEILVLREFKNKYSLQVEHLEKENLFSENISDKPSSLFIDYKNNVYIDFKDSLCQVYFMNDSLFLLNTLTSKDSIQFLKSILCIDSVSIFIEEYKHLKKKYELNKLSLKKLKQIHIQFDEIGYKVANSYRNQIITTYHKSIPEEQNIILLGTWSGNLLELVVNHEIANLYTFLKHIRGKSINIKSFKTKFGILTINLEKDFIFYYSLKGNLLYKNSIKRKFNKNKYSAIKDHLNNKFYLLNEVDYFKNLYQINELTGELILKKRFDFVKFPKKIKIFGNDIYFLAKNKNQNFKLFKTKIND